MHIDFGVTKDSIEVSNFERVDSFEQLIAHQLIGPTR